MPLLRIHLLGLKEPSRADDYVRKLRTEAPALKLVLASKPHHWVAKPRVVDVPQLTGQEWHLMLVTGSHVPVEKWPKWLRSGIQDSYSLAAGVPRAIFDSYRERNAQLLREAPHVPLTGSLGQNAGALADSSQDLKLDAELKRFMEDHTARHGEHAPVTMLNLLSFKANGRNLYAEYGKAFQSVGGRRGGNAKMVGSIVHDANPPRGHAGWDEVAIVHYPSIRHFCDMAAGEDYQAINSKYRLPSLKDTMLLGTSEIDLGPRSKL